MRNEDSIMIFIKSSLRMNRLQAEGTNKGKKMEVRRQMTDEGGWMIDEGRKYENSKTKVRN